MYQSQLPVRKQWRCVGIAIGCLVVLIPMVLVRDVSKLSPLMIISTLCMLLTILTVIYFSVAKLIDKGTAPGIEYIVSPSTCLVFVGMGAFLFGKIGIIVPIRDIMQNKAEFHGCLIASMWSIFGIFAGFGVIGYLAFGRDENMARGGGMITLALDQGNTVIQSNEFLFMLSLIPSFALMIYVPIKIWEQAMFSTWSRSCTRTWLKNLGRVLIVCFVCYLAIATGKTFDRVMALFGSLFGGPTTYLWPAIFHLRLIAKTPKEKMRNYLLIVFGLLASGLTLFMTIKKLMAPK